MVYQSIKQLIRDYNQLLRKITVAEELMVNYLNYNPLIHTASDIISFERCSFEISKKIILMRKRLVEIDSRRYLYYLSLDLEYPVNNDGLNILNRSNGLSAP